MRCLMVEAVELPEFKAQLRHLLIWGGVYYMGGQLLGRLAHLSR